MIFEHSIHRTKMFNSYSQPLSNFDFEKETQVFHPQYFSFNLNFYSQQTYFYPQYYYPQPFYSDCQQDCQQSNDSVNESVNKFGNKSETESDNKSETDSVNESVLTNCSTSTKRKYIKKCDKTTDQLKLEREKRRLSNKISAAKYRDKRREYIEELKAQILMKGKEVPLFEFFSIDTTSKLRGKRRTKNHYNEEFMTKDDIAPEDPLERRKFDNKIAARKNKLKRAIYIQTLEKLAAN